VKTAGKILPCGTPQHQTTTTELRDEDEQKKIKTIALK
jgi:hypothetical protein